NIRVCRRDGNGYAAFSAPADLYNYQPENYLYTPSERYNVFSTGSYKVTDKIRTFFEGSYINRKSDQRLAPEPLFTASAGIAISADSVYNPIGENTAAASWSSAPAARSRTSTPSASWLASMARCPSRCPSSRTGSGSCPTTSAARRRPSSTRVTSS
ncbi:MAG TPA: hypothetical protein PLV68_17810, partial [Ilumatobacteraceae bacterium]|nr:hypothetical protein [Ilumatobacteraceae bacterium]